MSIDSVSGEVWLRVAYPKIPGRPREPHRRIKPRGKHRLMVLKACLKLLFR